MTESRSLRGATSFLAGTATCFLLLPTVAFGAPTAAAQGDYQRVLSFESPALAGWSGGPRETLSSDSVVGCRRPLTSSQFGSFLVQLRVRVRLRRGPRWAPTSPKSYQYRIRGARSTAIALVSPSTANLLAT